METIIMITSPRLFEIEQHDNTLILTPSGNLGEFAMADFHEETGEILASCERSQVRYLLVDLHRTEYLQSTALRFFQSLRQIVNHRQGMIAFCGISPQGQEALEDTHLDRLWPVFASKEEALDALGSQN